jgi:hypothetical protein
VAGAFVHFNKNTRTVTRSLSSESHLNIDATLAQNPTKTSFYGHSAVEVKKKTRALTLTLILFLQPETAAIFGSIHRLCHSNYDLSTPAAKGIANGRQVTEVIRWLLLFNFF